jgi:hypothetical protein
MAKRVSKAEKAVTGWLFVAMLVIGVPVFLFKEMNNSMG